MSLWAEKAHGLVRVVIPWGFNFNYIPMSVDALDPNNASLSTFLVSCDTFQNDRLRELEHLCKISFVM